MIVPFEPEHLLNMKHRFPDSLEMGLVEDAEALAKGCAVAGPAFTLLEDSVVASAGVIMLWRGVGEAWAFTSEDVKKYKFAFHRAIFGFLNDQHDNFHRIQTTVREGNEISVGWLKRMGFIQEGPIMKNYGPDKAGYYRLARLF